MEFDPRCFFEHPPRMQEPVKQFLRELAREIVVSTLLTARTLGIERITEANVKLLVVQLTNDTVVAYSSKHGLVAQLTKIRPISKIVCKSIDDLDLKDRYSNLDRKIVKGVGGILQEYAVKATNGGKLALAVTVSETCGIAVQSAAQTLADKTMTLDGLKKSAFLYRTSKDETCINDSLFRFVTYTLPRTQLPIPQISDVAQSTRPRAATDFEQFKTKSEKRSQRPDERLARERRPKEAKTAPDMPVSILKKVQFVPTKTLGPARPSTPDACFWED
jgi:hypothetical protein